MAINEKWSMLKNNGDVFYRSAQAIISIAGVDAAPFLSRLATNDLDQIKKGGFMQTSFANNKGRMVDHCLLFAHGSDEIIVASAHDNAAIIIEWLEHYHFVEDIHIKDVSADFALYFGIGPACAQDPNAHLVWTHTLEDKSELAIFSSLKPFSGSKLSDDEWDSIRISCLMPKSPHEIHDGVMPQNINLTNFISETKGCYIGQEVIAKARTYQKQVKSLCGLAVDENIFAKLERGLRVKNHQGHVGELTSVAPLYISGETNALLISDLTEKTASDGDILLIDKCFISKKALP